jgi:hypothetical protein
MTVRARLTTPEDLDIGLPMYDYTALNAVATCPTWGITRYVRHKSPSADEAESREMALEAGTVIHKCMEAIGLWQLRAQGLVDHFDFHRKRLFADDSILFDGINEKESTGTQLRKLCERVIEASDFYDDPNDAKRSITVIEDTLSAYIDRFMWTETPLWVRDENDPTQDVGIEMKVDMVVKTERHALRYIGRLDRLVWTSTDKTEVMGIDYKTTSMNFSEAWDSGFVLSPQVTGYCVYSSLYTDTPVWRFGIHGMRLPVPARAPYNGIRFLSLQRGEHHVEQWGQWIDWCLDTINNNYAEPQHAPKFNHSCNRYFRMCPLMHMCDGDRAWRDEVFNSMGEKVWNPHD